MKRKVMRALAGLCAFLVIGSSAGAEIYKWRDSNGTLKFGDTMPAGVQYEKIEEVEESKPFQASQVEPQVKTGGKIDDINLTKATIIFEQKKDYFSLNLRPEIINRNSDKLSIRFRVSFLDNSNVEIHISQAYYDLNGNTRSINPMFLDRVVCKDVDFFNINAVRYIIIRYGITGSDAEKTLNSNIELQKV